jgi:Transposase DDE domain
MERKLWTELYPIVVAVCQRISHPKVVFTDRWILLAYFWAVIHDRPTSWACQRLNWPDDLCPAQLPSQPTMSRRLRTPHIQWALALILEQWRADPAASLLKCIDAKPLPVGGASKDPDAHWGRGTRTAIKGYKLFALWGPGPVPLAWEVRSADCSESTEADRLIPHLGGGGYLLADAIYDCNRLYDLAMRHNHQLIAPPKRPGQGLGHCYQSPHRLRGLDLLASPFGQALYAARDDIERDFGHLTSFGGGLTGLPSWVRRLGRVGMWVEAKLIINGVRDLLKQRLTA